MINLLQETKDIIKARGKTTKDVQFVMRSQSNWEQIEPEWCTWNEFAEAADFEYDDGFGGEEINLTLKVVGSDWWLERHEYDGSEWWEFKTMPTKPATHSRFPLNRVER